MLKPGLLLGETLEANSMALAIEVAMIDQGILVIDDETPEAAENRRKSFIAIATGVITHLKAHLEITIAANKISAGQPPAAVKVLGSAGEIA
jgi:hypothetical protein